MGFWGDALGFIGDVVPGVDLVTGALGISTDDPEFGTGPTDKHDLTAAEGLAAKGTALGLTAAQITAQTTVRPETAVEATVNSSPSLLATIGGALFGGGAEAAASPAAPVAPSVPLSGRTINVPVEHLMALRRASEEGIR